MLPSLFSRFFQCCGSGSVGPYIFGRPGSGSVSFYHQAKIVRKILIPTVLLLLFDFLSLKKDVNVPSKRNKQKNLISFLLASWRSMTTKIGGSTSGSISQSHGSADPDPDPHQNVMYPQHWIFRPASEKPRPLLTGLWIRIWSDRHHFGGSGSRFVSIWTKFKAKLYFSPEKFSIMSKILKILTPMTLKGKI